MKYKKVKYLKDGDVFWFTPDPELNPELMGDDWVLTGLDQVFIRDDYNHETMLVNGGFELCINPNEMVLVITTYREMMIKKEERKKNTI